MIDYPSSEDIHLLHERIVERSPETEPGTRTPAAVESALAYISEGYFGQKPETIHEKAAHLMRLIAAEHPYVDGNKRTAMAAAGYLFDINGYALEPDDEIRSILREFATDAEDVDMDRVVAYLKAHTTEHS